LLVLSIGLLAAGCGGGTVADRASPAPSGSAASSPGSPAPSDPAPSDPAPSDPSRPDQPLVSYERHGGLAGLSEQLLVLSDGTYTFTGRSRSSGTGKLTAAELGDLRRELEAVDFASLPADSPLRIADGFTHVVRYAGRQVRAGDGNIPKALGPVIALLDRILRRLAG
jgi:hypothetical protein